MNIGRMRTALPGVLLAAGIAARGHRDYVVVALFDNATGRRIENPEVTASVMEIGLAGQWKKLEPRKIARTVTYGDYFDFPSKDVYHVTVRIHIPEGKGLVETRFGHQHFGQ